MRQRRRLWLLTVVLFLHVLPAYSIQRGDTVAILPFDDHSDFPGTWDLRRGLPEQLAISLHSALGLVVLPHDSVATALTKVAISRSLTIDQTRDMGAALGVDFVLTGDIVDFSIRRFSVGNPFVAGYASYTALVDVEIRLFRTFPGATGVESFRGVAEETADDLGLTLLGKPTRTGAVHTQLNDVIFGGDVFWATPIGKATQRSVGKIVDGLATKVLDETVALKGAPRILSLEGSEGFVNFGIADEVEAGHRFDVYSKADSQRVGAIQVVVPLGAHLSQIRTVEGEQQIRPGDVLRAPAGR